MLAKQEIIPRKLAIELPFAWRAPTVWSLEDHEEEKTHTNRLKVQTSPMSAFQWTVSLHPQQDSPCNARYC